MIKLLALAASQSQILRERSQSVEVKKIYAEILFELIGLIDRVNEIPEETSIDV